MVIIGIAESNGNLFFFFFFCRSQAIGCRLEGSCKFCIFLYFCLFHAIGNRVLFCIIHRSFTRSYKSIPAIPCIPSVVFRHIILLRKSVYGFQIPCCICNIFFGQKDEFFQFVCIVVCDSLIFRHIYCFHCAFRIFLALFFIKEQLQICLCFFGNFAIGCCAHICTVL